MSEKISSSAETSEQKLRHCIAALKIIEERYRRGEVDLNTFLYAMNEVQSTFYTELQALGIIKGDADYKELYQADVTDEGLSYTKILQPDVEAVPEPRRPEEVVIELVNKLRPILPPEVVSSALEKARDPKITEGALAELLNSLLTYTLEKLNKS